MNQEMKWKDWESELSEIFPDGIDLGNKSRKSMAYTKVRGDEGLAINRQGKWERASFKKFLSANKCAALAVFGISTAVLTVVGGVSFFASLAASAAVAAVVLLIMWRMDGDSMHPTVVCPCGKTFKAEHLRCPSCGARILEKFLQELFP